MARNVQELIDERNTLLHDLLEARARLAEVERALDDERARNQHDRDLVRELTAELHRLRGCEHTPDWHAGLTWCTNCGRSAGGAAGDDRG